METQEEIISELNEDVNTLNILFADRILKYIGLEKFNISNVEYDENKKITIYLLQKVDTNVLEFDKLKGLINETIEIKTV